MATSIRVNWRWLTAGLLALLVGGAAIQQLHQWQLSRIGQHLLFQARQLTQAGQSQQAAEKYSACVSLLPDSPHVLVEYAQLLLQEPTSTEHDTIVFQLLTDALHQGHTSDQVRIPLVHTAMRLKNYAAAEQTLHTLDLPALSDARLYSVLGQCRLVHGDTDAAEQAFRQALQIDSGCGTAWGGLIRVASEGRQDFDEALRVADNMIQASAGAAGYRARARLLSQMGRQAAARTAWVDAVRRSPKDPSLAMELAEHIMRHNLRDIPQEEHRNVVQLAYDSLAQTATRPDYRMASLLGDLAQQKNDLTTSRKHYQQCLELKPRDPFAIGRMTELYTEEGNYEAAEQTLQTLPNWSKLTLLRNTLQAGILADQEKWQAASDLLRPAVDLAGDVSLRQYAHLLLVHCLNEQQQYQDAVVYARELMDLSAGADPARGVLVDTLLSAERFDDAIAQMQNFSTPEQYINTLIPSLIEKATAVDRLNEVRQQISRTRHLHSSAAIPVIFQAWDLSAEGHPESAVQVLAKSVVEHPDVFEYQHSLRQMQRRLPDIDNVEQLSDLATVSAQLGFCRSLLDERQDFRLHTLLKQHLDHNDSAEATELAGHALCLVAEHRSSAAAQDLLQQIHLPLQDGFARHGLQVAGPVAAGLGACGHTDWARQVLASAVVAEQPQTLAKLISVIRQQARTSPSDTRHWIQHAKHGLDVETQQLLLAETIAVHGDTSAALDVLPKISKLEHPCAVAAWIRLTCRSQPDSPQLEDAVHWLSQQPDLSTATAAIVCRGFLASGRHQEAVSWAAEAWSRNRDPVLLLLAADARWKSGQPRLCRLTLELAVKEGINKTTLSSEDQQMLDTLLQQPFLQSTPVPDETDTAA